MVARKKPKLGGMATGAAAMAAIAAASAAGQPFDVVICGGCGGKAEVFDRRIDGKPMRAIGYDEATTAALIARVQRRAR